MSGTMVVLAMLAMVLAGCGDPGPQTLQPAADPVAQIEQIDAITNQEILEIHDSFARQQEMICYLAGRENIPQACPAVATGLKSVGVKHDRVRRKP